MSEAGDAREPTAVDRSEQHCPTCGEAIAGILVLGDGGRRQPCGCRVRVSTEDPGCDASVD